MLSTHLVLAESQDQQIGEEISNPTFHQGALTSVFGVEYEFTIMSNALTEHALWVLTTHTIIYWKCIVWLCILYSLRCYVYIVFPRSRLYVPSSGVEEQQ